MDISKMEIALLVLIVFGSLITGYAAAEGRRAVTVCEDQVTKLPGYATRQTKRGHVNHLAYDSKDEALKMMRRLDENSYINQTEPEYELVELFYRKVK